MCKILDKSEKLNYSNLLAGSTLSKQCVYSVVIVNGHVTGLLQFVGALHESIWEMKLMNVKAKGRFKHVIGLPSTQMQDEQEIFCSYQTSVVFALCGRGTLRWAVLTVLWIGFCHTGPISLCVDLFICVHLCVLCVIVLYCIVVVVLWVRSGGPDGIEA